MAPRVLRSKWDLATNIAESSSANPNPDLGAIEFSTMFLQEHFVHSRP